MIIMETLIQHGVGYSIEEKNKDDTVYNSCICNNIRDISFFYGKPEKIEPDSTFEVEETIVK